VTFLLQQLFPEGDFRFHLALRRSAPANFFRRGDAAGRICAERKRWLAADPERYVALMPEGETIVEEFGQFCHESGLITGMLPSALSSRERLFALGEMLETDVLFLSPDVDGTFRLRAGVLCFPTGWDLREKLGHTLDWIHGIVPGLNAALGSPIQNFLGRLKPGVAFLRDNWGIAATDALNLHPSRNIAPPTSPVNLRQLWLRVENQALLALPKSRGVVFGIKISLLRLDDLAMQSEMNAGLRRALETMPEEVVSYKRLSAIKRELIQRLAEYVE